MIQNPENDRRWTAFVYTVLQEENPDGMMRILVTNYNQNMNNIMEMYLNRKVVIP
jgi:hypothetical protein